MSETPQFPAPAFARRFRLLMAWHDLTLREIASATHNALSTVGTWKNGRLPPSRDSIARLAEIFQVPVSYLLTGQVEASSAQADDIASRILLDLDLLSHALDQGAAGSSASPGEISQRTKPALSPP